MHYTLHIFLLIPILITHTGGGRGDSAVFQSRKNFLGPEEVEAPRLSSALQGTLNVLGQAASLSLGRSIMSFQIRGWRSSEQLRFIGNFAAATREHLQDIKAALSPRSIVNMSCVCVALVLSMVTVVWFTSAWFKTYYHSHTGEEDRPHFHHVDLSNTLFGLVAAIFFLVCFS